MKTDMQLLGTITFNVLELAEGVYLQLVYYRYIQGVLMT